MGIIVLNWVGLAVTTLAGLYLIILVLRMVIDWIRFFRPFWRPTGLMAVGANAVYGLTDPPLRALRQYVPPLRLGAGFALDVGFMILFLAVMVLQNLGMWLQSLS